MATYTGKPQVNKRTLGNYIRHADTSNKVMEEREMWRLRGLELRGRFSDFSLPVVSREKQHSTIIRGRLVSDSVMLNDEEDRGKESKVHSGNYWFRQLMKAEENDPDRWGHSGYKELYPEECLSSSNDEKESLGIPIHHKRRHSHKKAKKKKSRHREEQEEKARIVAERECRPSELKSKFRKHRHKHDGSVGTSSTRKSRKHRDEAGKKHSRKKKLVRTHSSSEDSSPHLTTTKKCRT